jgi:chemotaxis family two-component system response regulator Rcp1
MKMGNNHVLLVEDSDKDSRLILEAFKELGIKCDVSVARDGVEAMDYLLKNGEFAGAKTPDVVILDIKLPRKNGIEVLKEIRANEKISNIPVVMLTNSDTRTDILESYDYQANSYITKPIAVADLFDVVKYISQTWLK